MPIKPKNCIANFEYGIYGQNEQGFQDLKHCNSYAIISYDYYYFCATYEITPKHRKMLGFEFFLSDQIIVSNLWQKF